MIKKRSIRLLLCLLARTAVSLVNAQEELSGDIACHDPSTIVDTGSRYCFFRTGSGVPYHYSDDLRDWSYGGRVFPSDPPAWVTNAVQDYDPGNWAWAPDVAYFNGQYHVYYSVSEWGTIDSVIGLVISPSLTAPSWTDRGKVVQSDAEWESVPETDTTTYNCIDPSILVDTNGTVWMTFGSYSSGIGVTEINPATGLRMNTNTLVATQVANNSGHRGWGSSIEGAFNYQHGGYYYLFVNYGGCCSGVDSTYKIRVGRSTSITGPYYDKDGVDMRDAGGTMLLESSGRFVGPGHAGIINDNGIEWFSYHYYTWSPGAWSQLGLLRLSWDEDDWQRIFDFGTDTANYMFLTPKAYGAGMRFAIRTGDSGGEQMVDAPFALPTDTWSHVAVTLDGEQGILYFNGEAVASNSVTIRPWEMMARSNYVGKSQWPDPGFDGRIASFRIFAHALAPEEVKEIAYAHPALAHRYSFVSDVKDKVGKAHGRLKGGASISGETLILPGTSGSYAQLPGGLVSGCGAVSIEFWAHIGANGNWARIFDFGNYSGAFGNSFLFLSPGMSTSRYLMDMNGTQLDVSGNLNNKSVHVVCIIDPAANYTAIYIDGELVQQQTASTSALDTIGKSWSFLGRSLFSADPYLNADIDEFRIYDGRLSTEEIADSFAAGPDSVYLPIIENDRPTRIGASGGAGDVVSGASGKQFLISADARRAFLGSPALVAGGNQACFHRRALHTISAWKQRSVAHATNLPQPGHAARRR